MYQVNIVIQWQDGHYEEIRGVGVDWKAAKNSAVQMANTMAVLKVQEFRVLTDKEWRALPKPVSCNNWVPKKPIPPQERPVKTEEKPSEESTSGKAISIYPESKTKPAPYRWGVRR